MDIELFVDSLSDLTKQNQSAYADGKQLTRAINMSSMELAQKLYSVFEINQNAVDLALPVTTAFTVTSNAQGIATYPNGYNHLLSLQYAKTSDNIIKCQRIGINQLGIIQKIPQRRADLSKDRILYYFLDTGIQVLPKGVLNFKGVFAKLPTKANISYTYSIVNGEGKRAVDQSTKVDIPWGDNCFNLLLYMVMDKLGFSSRELIVSEYARMGIQKEEVKQIN